MLSSGDSHRLMPVNRWISTAALLLFAIAPANAQSDSDEAGETISAARGIDFIESSEQNRYEQISATHFQFVGAVEMNLGSSRFFADQIDVFTDTFQILASGNVVFASGEGMVAADRVEFDVVNGLGTFYEASGILALGAAADPAQFGTQDADVYFYAEVLEKTGTRSYRLTRGGFSTCVQPTPRWEMTSGDITLNLDEYAIARNMVLRVKGVPVFYLPIIYYPIQEDNRATGLLMPSFGASTLRGPSISNAFFWAIGRSQDATFFYDWFTRAGQGLGTEYRYASGPSSSGRIRMYRFSQDATIFESTGEALPAQSSYEVSASMTQVLGTRLRARARVDYFSDVVSQQLFNQNLFQATRQTRLVEAGLSGTFGPLQASAQYQRNELFSNRQDTVLFGSTPRLTADLAQQRLFGSTVYGSLSSEFSYQPYRFLSDGVVTRDDTRAVFQVAPQLRVPLSRLTYLSVNTSATHRVTYYSRSVSPDGERAEPVSLTRQFLALETEFVGPVLNRIWDTDSDFAERLKHVIEPTVGIEYATEFGGSERAPLLPLSVDSSIDNALNITYGVTNRFFARARAQGPITGQTREFLMVALRQTWYSNEEAGQFDTSYASSFLGQELTDLSPIALTARVTPSRAVDGNLSLEYNVSGGGLRSATVGARFSSGRNSTSFNYSRRQLLPESDPDSFLIGSTSLSTRNGRMSGSYTLSWDIARQYISNQAITATYLAQCCGLQFEFQNYSYPSSSGFPIPADRRFNFGVVLAGLGTFSNFFGSFGG